MSATDKIDYSTDSRYYIAQIVPSVLVVAIIILLSYGLLTDRAVKAIVGIALIGCAGWLAVGDQIIAGMKKNEMEEQRER